MSSTTIPRKTEYMPPTLSTSDVAANAMDLDGFKPSRSRRDGICLPAMIGRKTEYIICYVGHLGAEVNMPQCDLDGFKPSRSIS